jgi:ribosomal protein S18 acetylase RimI-like enzyme
VADIKFFGLGPEFIGKRIGRYFLTQSLSLAWSLDPKRVQLETCTLDHPAALSLYQKLGFTVFDQRKGQVELIEAAASA